MSARWSFLTVGAMLGLLVGTMPAVAATEGPDQAHSPFSRSVERALLDLDTRGVLEGTDCAPPPGDCGGDLPRWEAFVWVSRVAGIDPNPHRAFRDVPSDLWWAPLAQGLFDNLVVWGCGVNPLRACPYRATTRAEMASMIVRSHGWPTGTVGFTDISEESVHYRDVEALGHGGFSNGCQGDPLRFCPDRAITRIEAAVMLAALFDADPRQRATSDGSSNSGTAEGGGNGGDLGNRNPGSGNPGGGETRTSLSAWKRTSGWGVACPAHRHDHPGESKGYAILLGPLRTEDGRWVERTGLWGHRHEYGTSRWWWWAPVDDANPQGGLHPRCDHEAEDH